jgi:hypothetical protein
MNALRLSAAAAYVAVILAAVALGACEDSIQQLWFCDDPATGKQDANSPYDQTHSVDGVFDPCHCYDPGGPLPQCPILVDAGSDAP